MSSTNKSCLKSQVKIINLIDSDCPRLKSSVVVRRNHRFFKWSHEPGQIKIFPRISRECSRKKTRRAKQKPRLSGFFQGQLRMMKAFKQQKGKSSSSNYEIVCNSASSVVLKKRMSNCFIKHMNMVDDELRKNRLRIHDLPTELLADILVRLPVKDILRCRSVQKSWNCFIKSPLFIGLQLNYQKQIITGNHNYYYHKYLFFEDEDNCDFTVRFDDVQCEEYCKLEFLPGLPKHDVWFALSYDLGNMSSNQTNKSCLKSQAKIMNLIDNDCPRLNNNSFSVVVRRTPRLFKWSPGPGQIKIIPRISCRKKTRRPKQKPRLSGFFQAQLRMMKAFKQQKGLGFRSSLPFVFLIGVFASSWLGATDFWIGEWIIKKMPFLKHIYSESKQITASISPEQNASAFKEVAIITHPRVGEYAFVFITSSVILQRSLYLEA